MDIQLDHHKIPLRSQIPSSIRHWRDLTPLVCQIVGSRDRSRSPPNRTSRDRLIRPARLRPTRPLTTRHIRARRRTSRTGILQRHGRSNSRCFTTAIAIPFQRPGRLYDHMRSPIPAIMRLVRLPGAACAVFRIDSLGGPVVARPRALRGNGGLQVDFDTRFPFGHCPYRSRVMLDSCRISYAT